MPDALDSLEQQLDGVRKASAPPLHLWHPELSGDIPIHIRADGVWFHEGSEIQRDALVRLFASILRRESDGEYYLVTPVEKWRISVELHPLVVVDVDVRGRPDTPVLWCTLNTGAAFAVDGQHRLFLEPTVGGVAALTLPQGLTALFS
ncbi:MAG: DUF1285 domain-containing protein, partial [Halioglobus sp.]|nr:DUF1285 domain-containing protein [Halioglobus sp.]